MKIGTNQTEIDKKLDKDLFKVKKDKLKAKIKANVREEKVVDYSANTLDFTYEDFEKRINEEVSKFRLTVEEVQ